MKIGQSSSETFADFTLSRLPQEIRDSFTDEQYGAIRTILIGRDENARHRIDIRLRFPLFLLSYYLVFFAGRDRRASVYWEESSRLSSIPRPLRLAVHYLFSIAMLMAILIVIFVVFYKFKTLMGIDIFSGFHLSDLWSSVCFSTTFEYA
ncbi:MAG: hypothetical protein ACI8P9_003518 [Parasphingorhabdus sp.]|jgi:hypothetical protein